jgi:hypothetical protein
MTFDEVRAIALSLPGVEESTSYGAPSFKVAGKLLACQPANAALRDGGRVLVLRDVEPEERALLVESEPDVFFFTDHYRNYPLVLVRLPAVTPERLRGYLERSWRAHAPKRLQR